MKQTKKENIDLNNCKENLHNHIIEKEKSGNEKIEEKENLHIIKINLEDI